MKLRGNILDKNNMGTDYYFPYFDDMVLYAGDLMTLDRQGIKKHYFVEGERFLTNCGSEGHPWADPKKALEGIDESELTMCKEFTDNIITYFAKHTPACYKIFDQKADISSELFDIADMYSYLLKEHNDLGSYYLHTDRLGSGSAVTDGRGEAVHVLGYMPYGETLLDLSHTHYETPYQFTGYEKDQETGLHYAEARYYDSWLSIFNSTDPMWYKYPHLSPYAYCANNPLMYVDPSGMVIDTTGLSQQGQQDYIHNINLLRNSPIFDAYYEHLEKSNNVYYIKEGDGYGGSGSFNESTNEVFSINDPEVLAQELFHAFQTDLNCYSREDMSVRETEGDLVSTNIIHNLNALGVSSSIANGLIWDTSITFSYVYRDKYTSAFNRNVLSTDFDIDFNKAVSRRVEYYRGMANEGIITPFSYTQSSSKAKAMALKYIIKLIYNTK